MNDKKQILIADDDHDLVDSLSMRCKRLGLDVIAAKDARDALANADFHAPDMAILDVRIPGGNGFSVSELMATDNRLRSTSVIMMTGEPNEQIQRRCEEMGARLVRKDQQIWTRLEPMIREMIHTEPSRPSPRMRAFSDHSDSWVDSSMEQPVMASLLEELADQDARRIADSTAGSDFSTSFDDETAEDDVSPWVLAIEDDPAFTLALQRRLLTFGVRLIRAYCEMEGYRTAFRSAPAAILLDYKLPDGDGESILRRLRESGATDGIPVIVVSGMADASLRRRMLAGGADAFLSKPVTWEKLRTVLKRLTDLKLNRPIQAMAHV